MSEEISYVIIILKIPYHCKSDTSITRKTGELTMQVILISISPSAQKSEIELCEHETACDQNYHLLT